MWKVIKSGIMLVCKLEDKGSEFKVLSSESKVQSKTTVHIKNPISSNRKLAEFKLLWL